MSKVLNERIAVVTGASSGIGLALAERLVADGARVVINARRRDRLEALAERLNHEAGGEGDRERCVAEAGDCAEPAVVRAVLARARDAFGAEADLVVVNAGRGLKGSVVDSDTGQWEEMIKTNLVGAAWLMREAAKAMVAAVEADAKAGRAWTGHARDIVVIGSVVGRNVSPFSSMYGSTKFGVHALAEGLRREVGPKGVRVSLVAPGFVVSEFQGVAGYDPAWFKGVLEKLGPALEPADVARTVSFLAGQPAHVHVGDVILRPTRQEYP